MALDTTTLLDQESMPNNFELNNVLRDGVQSNLGTNLSADEIIEMLLHTKDAEYAEYQISGGTFMDLFLKKGRDAFGENTKLFNAFEDVITSALIRGDCLTGYQRNPQDVIDAVIEELAERGLNVVTNFHGLNYAPMQEGVFKAVLKAQEKGYEIKAPKVLCIEDNPNITIESCMAALAEQAEMGASEGVYLKNASGKVDPDFVYELTKRVAAEYPGEKITLHTHDNHGLADAIYMRGAEAAAEMDANIAFDVLPRAMASGTAQPPAWRIAKMLQSHPSEKVRARAPQYDESKEAADFEKQYAMRHLYGKSEVRYDKKAWDACYEAGMAGGAMAAIKGMGVLPTVKSMYGLEDEDAALALVASVEADVKAMMGYPTSVTPYQKTMDEQAVLELELRKSSFKRINKEGEYIHFSQLHDNTAYFLSGGLGPVPQPTKPKWIETALNMRGLDQMEEFVPADELPPGMDAAKKLLVEAGYSEPSRSDVALTAILGDAAFKEVMIRSGQSILPVHHETREAYVVTNEGEGHWLNRQKTGRYEQKQGPRKVPSPAKPPEWPSYLQKPTKNHEFKPTYGTVTEYDVAQALGGAAELERFSLAVAELEKHTDGFYKTGIGPAGFFKRSREGQSLRKQFSEKHSDVRAGVDYIEQAHAEAHAAAQEEVQAFMDAIPQKLADYGMSLGQVSGANQTGLIARLLTEVVDRKAKNASRLSLPSLDVQGIYSANYSKPSTPTCNLGGGVVRTEGDSAVAAGPA